MITWNDLYTVLAAVVPLYVAMILAYGSVRWWKIFSPDQCSGINRFVAIFAVPLLSFHFISTNDPYAMNLKFITADTLQKLIMLAGLAFWVGLTPTGTLDWLITIFSLSTLPNTLVMGIPLLIAMYGTYAGSLMVQVVVLQCIIWYTVLLFLFEYRAAKILITDQFPNIAAEIVSFKVDSDVVSLDGGSNLLQAEAEFGEDGKFHVIVRKSTSSRRSSVMTPRASNLTGSEIYSMNSSPRGSNFNQTEFYSLMGSRLSNSEENQRSPSRFVQYPTSNPEIAAVTSTATGGGKNSNRFQRMKQKDEEPQLVQENNHDAKELHVWSGSGSPVSDAGDKAGNNAKEIRMIVPSDLPQSKVTPEVKGNGASEGKEEGPTKAVLMAAEEGVRMAGNGGGKQMPPASVMSRLILIMVWRKLMRNPNTYSSLVGVIWSLVAFRWNVQMPKIVEKSINILSDAGLGMAMFSLGLFMALQPKLIACGNRVATYAMGVRFLTGPAVMAAASLVIGLRGTLLRIAIVQAALPQGIVPFVFAKEYNVHPAILSTAVIFGMLVALPITLLYYILLGV